MNLQHYLPAIIAVLVLARVIWTQFRWRPVREGRIWVLPAVLVALGIYVFLSAATRVTPLELVTVAGESVISIAAGAVMGVIARFRTADIEADSAPDSLPGATRPGLESRTGWWGLALWAVVIAVRVGLLIWAGRDGLGIVEAATLFTLGLNRAARALVLDLRARRLRADLAAN